MHEIIFPYFITREFFAQKYKKSTTLCTIIFRPQMLISNSYSIFDKVRGFWIKVILCIKDHANTLRELPNVSTYFIIQTHKSGELHPSTNLSRFVVQVLLSTHALYRYACWISTRWCGSTYTGSFDFNFFPYFQIFWEWKMWKFLCSFHIRAIFKFIN